jgi:hypothetical protein
MAKVGGRVGWIAWPAMLACVVVVAGLVWFAVPGIPGAVTFIGNTLRAATSAPAADGADSAAAFEPATDCRSLYPDRLWAELTWTPDVLLLPGTAAPATATTLVAALGPSVRFSCTWRTEDGRSIQTTVSDVAADASAIAEAALGADAFACERADERLHCSRERDGVTEVHDIVGGVWVGSSLVGWTPGAYAEQVLSRVVSG